jgi:hypothetical protein
MKRFLAAIPISPLQGIRKLTQMLINGLYRWMVGRLEDGRVEGWKKAVSAFSGIIESTT